MKSSGSPFEVFIWQKSGTSCVLQEDEPPDLYIEGSCCVIPKGSVYEWELTSGASIVSIANAYT